MNVYELDGSNLSVEDLEFQAENTLIDVVPNFREDTMHMIVGDFGPFRPSMPVTVPLWLAIMLKKMRKCRIKAPEWLNEEKLQAVLDEEKDDATQNLQLTDFGLPLYYNLTAQVLLREAPDDVPENHRCRTLLRDLEDTRKSKIRRGTHMVMDEVTKNDDVHQVSAMINFRNLTPMELNMVRPTLRRGLDCLAQISSAGDEITSGNTVGGVSHGGGGRRDAATAAGGTVAGQAYTEDSSEPKRKLRKYRQD